MGGEGGGGGGGGEVLKVRVDGRTLRSCIRTLERRRGKTERDLCLLFDGGKQLLCLTNSCRQPRCLAGAAADLPPLSPEEAPYGNLTARSDRL